MVTAAGMPNGYRPMMLGGMPQGAMAPSVMPMQQQYPQQAFIGGQQTPQYGLAGSEAALNQGAQGAIGAMQGGIDQARMAMMNQFNQGMGQLASSASSARNNLQGGYMAGADALRSGVTGAENVLSSQYGTGLNAFNQGIGNAQQNITQGYGNANAALNNSLLQAQQYGQSSIDAINSGRGQASSAINSAIKNTGKTFDEGVSALNQFVQPGVQANNLLGKYLGLGAPGEQQQAMAAYMESPELAYQQERAQKAILQNSRALGGVGGNQMLEIARDAQGRAAQGYNAYLDRLSGASAQGLGAASNVGSLRGQQAGIQSNLASQNAQNAMQAGSSIANINSMLGEGSLNVGGRLSDSYQGMAGNLANLNTLGGQTQLGAQQQLGESIAGIRNNAGQALMGANQNLGAGMADIDAGYGLNALGASQNLGSSLGNLFAQGGQTAADYLYNTGVNLAGGRTNAGNALSGISSQQAADLNSIIGAGSSNLGNLFTGTAGQVNQQQGNLAQLLAGLYGQNASVGGNQTSSAQFLNNQGIATQLAQLMQGVGTAAAASDIQLKDNIQFIGKMNGHRFYTWDWNEIGKKVAGNQPSVGVIAQEVMHINPEAVTVGDDGYMRVNYSMVM